MKDFNCSIGGVGHDFCNWKGCDCECHWSLWKKFIAWLNKK